MTRNNKILLYNKYKKNIIKRYFLRELFPFHNIFTGNDQVRSCGCATLVKRTCLTCRFSFPSRVYSSVLVQERTRDTPNLEITWAVGERERGPRGAQSPQGHSFARGRSVSLIRSRVKCHSLLCATVTPGSRYFELFGSRSIELSRFAATSIQLCIYVIKQRLLTSFIDSL